MKNVEEMCDEFVLYYLPLEGNRKCKESHLIKKS